MIPEGGKNLELPPKKGLLSLVHCKHHYIASQFGTLSKVHLSFRLDVTSDTSSSHSMCNEADSHAFL